MPILTSNRENLLDLLRTHNAEVYLQRRSSNHFVAALNELLNALGFGNELQYKQMRDPEYFGEETLNAVLTFADRNRLLCDGMGVPAPMLHLMLMRFDAIDGLQLLQRSLANQQLDLAFNIDDPENTGTRHLRKILENLDIYEETVPFGLGIYASQKGFSSKYQLTPPLAQSILDDLVPCYGAGLNLGFTSPDRPLNPLPPTPVAKLEVVVLPPDFVAVSDGNMQVRFKQHFPAGVSTGGSRSITRFIDDYNEQLTSLDLTPSAISVMKAVSLNEGSFDGINTYDKGFLSMGIFQWTLGQDEKKGELPAMLKNIKSFYPATFETFFKAHGIDISPDTDTTYGYLMLEGNVVAAPAQKDLFRDPRFAFRFWRAAQEPDVQAIQIEHALNRLKNFYWKENYAALGFTLNKLITSSYGVALLLDNHVNRPSWVNKCVQQAMINAGLNTDPSFWTDQDEMTLISAYLAVRETYAENTYSPMTASRRRAEKMSEGVTQGWLSTQRGSFQMSSAELAIRSSVLQPLSYETPLNGSALATPKEVPPPPFYVPEDYPDIIMEINE